MSSIFRAGFWLALAVTFYLTLRPIPIPTDLSDKTGHLLAFGTLLALAAAGYPGARLLPLAAAISGLGALIEFLQPLTGRSKDGWDWVADTTGVLIALLLIVSGRALLRRRNPPN